MSTYQTYLYTHNVNQYVLWTSISIHSKLRLCLVYPSVRGLVNALNVLTDMKTFQGRNRSQLIDTLLLAERRRERSKWILFSICTASCTWRQDTVTSFINPVFNKYTPLDKIQVQFNISYKKLTFMPYI